MGVLDEAIAARLDVLVCGELTHMGHHTAKEAGLAAVLGGHYATETLGLKALMRSLPQHFPVETVWLEAPTGL